MRWYSDTWTDTQITGHGGRASIGHYRASQNRVTRHRPLVLVQCLPRSCGHLKQGAARSPRSTAQINRTANKRMGLIMVATSC